MKLFAASECSCKELLDFDNAAMAALFPSFSTIDAQRHDELMVYFEKVNSARNHPGFTFLFHYQEYAQEAWDPYSFTQYMEYYRRKYTKVKGSMI